MAAFRQLKLNHQLETRVFKHKADFDVSNRGERGRNDGLNALHRIARRPQARQPQALKQTDGPYTLLPSHTSSLCPIPILFHRYTCYQLVPQLVAFNQSCFKPQISVCKTEKREKIISPKHDYDSTAGPQIGPRSQQPPGRARESFKFQQRKGARLAATLQLDTGSLLGLINTELGSCHTRISVF